jgi:hypothetical protein
MPSFLLIILANGPYFEEAVTVMSKTCCEAEASRNINLMVRHFEFDMPHAGGNKKDNIVAKLLVSHPY